MKNIALWALWILLLVLVGFFVYFGLVNIKDIKKSKEIYVIGTTTSPCYPKNQLSLLPDTGNLCCSDNQSLRKFTISNGNIEAVIGQNPVSPNIACSSLCNSYNPLTKKCNDSTSNQNYYKCINILTPVDNCTSASMPVAQTENAPFYVQTTNLSSCQTTIPCT